MRCVLIVVTRRKFRSNHPVTDPFTAEIASKSIGKIAVVALAQDAVLAKCSTPCARHVASPPRFHSNRKVIDPFTAESIFSAPNRVA